MKSFFTPWSLILLLSIPFSQTVLAEPATKASVTKLMEITGATQQSKLMAQQMVPMLKKMMPNAPDRFWQEFIADIKPEDVHRQIVPIYQKHLTEQEVLDIIAFYQTPSGKKLQEAQPKISRESMLAGQIWGQQIAKKILDKYKRLQKQQAKQRADESARSVNDNDL